MPETQTPAEEPVSLVNARALDRLCDRFEAAWRADGRPSLGAFLAEAPAALRAQALRQLLLLDVEYRRAPATRPSSTTTSPTAATRPPSFSASWGRPPPSPPHGGRTGG